MPTNYGNSPWVTTPAGPMPQYVPTNAGTVNVFTEQGMPAGTYYDPSGTVGNVGNALATQPSSDPNAMAYLSADMSPIGYAAPSQSYYTKPWESYSPFSQWRWPAYVEQQAMPRMAQMNPSAHYLYGIQQYLTNPTQEYLSRLPQAREGAWGQQGRPSVDEEFEPYARVLESLLQPVQTNNPWAQAQRRQALQQVLDTMEQTVPHLMGHAMLWLNMLAPQPVVPIAPALGWIGAQTQKSSSNYRSY